MSTDSKRTEEPAQDRTVILNRMDAFLHRHEMFYLYLRTLRCWITLGPAEARKRYDDYVNMNHPHSYRGYRVAGEEKWRQRNTVWDGNVLFSLMVPVCGTVPAARLRETVRSVLNQTYEKWELCIADGGPEQSETGRYCRKMARKDPRIWYQHMEGNPGFSDVCNACLSMAKGEYLAFLSPKDLLHPSALFETAKAIDLQSADFIYTDEAIFSQKLKDVRRFLFKPDYSPDLLRSCNYIGHLSVFSRGLMEKAGDGYSPDPETDRDYDLVLRLTENAHSVVHIPKELYYQRIGGGSERGNGFSYPDGAKNAVSAYLKRTGMTGEVLDAAVPGTCRVRYRIIGSPRVSIVIPNMDHPEDLRKCVDSIRKKTTWQNWEIIIVENNSSRDEIFRYYQEITGSDPRIRVVRWDKEFNFSAVCNYGVSFATGEYVLLLNNDTEVITPGWLEEMLMFAQRGDVGAVGCMLYYPDDTVQHAGVIIGTGIAAGHAFRGFPRGAEGYMSRLAVAQNVSAVTGACMMISRKVYDEVSGLDESFRVGLNDVDFCLRIRGKGYFIVFTPFAELYHFESKSRGLDEEGRNRERFETEAAHFREKWQAFRGKGDPYYNPNLTLRREDYSIRDEDEKEGVWGMRMEYAGLA